MLSRAVSLEFRDSSKPELLSVSVDYGISVYGVLMATPQYGIGKGTNHTIFYVRLNMAFQQYPRVKGLKYCVVSNDAH